MLGARVTGFALEPQTAIDLFNVAGVAPDIAHNIGDVRDLVALTRALEAARPEIVIHMAAQALVRQSYQTPVETYATNVMGTVNVLDAVRRVASVKAVVVVTSDKCYDNKEWHWGYRENEALGGRDPYSSSKGCAELVTASYRDSFFTSGDCRVASGRAGNVIGGGDWSPDRLVPDAMRAFARREPLRIRSPEAIRPWQHVMEPVTAYLILTQQLAGPKGGEVAEAWNFGPAASSEIAVGDVADRLVNYWGSGAEWIPDRGPHLHEASFLKLDCSKARQRLGWSPLTDVDDSLRLSVEWYRAYYNGADMRGFTLSQITEFLERQMTSCPRTDS
jgi:CDP-glucose 4,6-dehydratase